MARTVMAWPTVFSVDRLDLADSENDRLTDAALILHERYREPGETRHYVSTLDDHRPVFPAGHQVDLDRLWVEIEHAIRSYMRTFGVVADYAIAWTLFVLTAKAGDCLKPHAHPQRDLFVCYYPRADGDAGGELRFIDTRPWPRKWVSRSGAFFDTTYMEVKVSRGTLVIAPGYALHETSPFAGNGMRVTYGFFVNLGMEKQYR